MSGAEGERPDRPGLVLTTEGRAREAFDDPALGDLSWFTLISGDRTSTERMSAGIMELPRGGGLAPHRHEQPEIYCVIAGSGVVRIAGVESAVAAGAVAYIPGDAEHAIRNAGDEVLRVFYVFPTDRFSDVVYRFSEPPGPARGDPSRTSTASVAP